MVNFAAVTYSKPEISNTTKMPKSADEKPKILKISSNQALEVVPFGPEPSREDGETMETANAAVFRPLFSYRKVQRRKYRYPNRRNRCRHQHYNYEFPTFV